MPSRTEHVRKGYQTISPASIQMTQQRLKEFGYDPGPINGMVGGHTTEALRRFQTERGLPVTGELDRETARRLRIELP
jgi:peptidoglycan hydrolase-like protein with peptidoglycan-binding domain